MWTLIKDTGTGHRFFRNESGAIAITDWSLRNMKDPSSTDDGLLLVNQSQPVTVGEHGYGISLISGKGDGKSSAIIGAGTAGYLVKELGMQLFVNGVGYVQWTVNPSGRAGSGWAMCR